MKKSILTSLLCLCTTFVFAQFCGTPKKANALGGTTARPTYANVNLSSQNANENQPYIIPVVVHVLHVNGPENISEQQINSAIDALNDDFNATNADLVDVIPEYQNLIGNAQIEFRLATLDPNGNPTNGIDRIYSPETNNGYDGSPHINQWPPNMYLNVWTVNSMGDSGAAAYAIYPETAEDYPDFDGVVSLHDYFGSIGTANTGAIHTFSHELGHYLGLIHTWGDVEGCSGTDLVNDTPPTIQELGCAPPFDNCTPGVIENYQNFMSYSWCFTMFTQGQVQRMHNSLNSSLANRNNLWQTSNLMATGVLQTAAVNDYAFADINPYPNPTTEVLHLDNTQHVSTITLLNTAGKQLKQLNVNTNNVTLSMADLASGIYFLHLSGSKGEKNIKIVKQ